MQGFAGNLIGAINSNHTRHTVKSARCEKARSLSLSCWAGSTTQKLYHGEVHEGERGVPGTGEAMEVADAKRNCRNGSLPVTVAYLRRLAGMPQATAGTWCLICCASALWQTHSEHHRSCAVLEQQSVPTVLIANRAAQAQKVVILLTGRYAGKKVRTPGLPCAHLSWSGVLADGAEPRQRAQTGLLPPAGCHRQELRRWRQEHRPLVRPRAGCGSLKGAA